MLPLKALHDTSLIQLGALIRLRSSDGEARVILFGSAAGGETIQVDGEEITIVTAQSPLGQAVLGKTVGDTFKIKIGRVAQTLTVMSVE
jgi:transcription elongation GreA/GreB family factor